MGRAFVVKQLAHAMSLFAEPDTMQVMDEQGGALG